MTDFPHLLSPLQVGPKRLRNRVLVTAHVPGLAAEASPVGVVEGSDDKESRSTPTPSPLL